MMLLPFLLNYLICWYVWATTDKRKTVTWVAALLSFHPQYVACKDHLSDLVGRSKERAQEKETLGEGSHSA